MTESMSVTVAYDPTSGQILRVHFTRAVVDTEEGNQAIAWLQGAAPAHARVVHLASGSMTPGKSYRMDVDTGTLVLDESGKDGLSASSGVTLVPQHPSDS